MHPCETEPCSRPGNCGVSLYPCILVSLLQEIISYNRKYWGYYHTLLQHYSTPSYKLYQVWDLSIEDGTWIIICICEICNFSARQGFSLFSKLIFNISYVGTFLTNSISDIKSQMC